MVEEEEGFEALASAASLARAREEAVGAERGARTFGTCGTGAGGGGAAALTGREGAAVAAAEEEEGGGGTELWLTPRGALAGTAGLTFALAAAAVAAAATVEVVSLGRKGA